MRTRFWLSMETRDAPPGPRVYRRRPAQSSHAAPRAVAAPDGRGEIAGPRRRTRAHSPVVLTPGTGPGHCPPVARARASGRPRVNMPSPPAPLLAVVALLAALAGPAPAAAAPGAGENLFRGPARCVLGYLEAVRLAGPHGRVLPLGSTRALERSYGAARALTAPRALEEVDRSVARGGDPPLAPWREAAR